MNYIEIRQTIILKQKQFINIKNQKIFYKKISSIFETYELKEKEIIFELKLFSMFCVFIIFKVLENYVSVR